MTFSKASYIAALRNHPSILVWTLCNEMYMGPTFKTDGIIFGAERFHAIKQELDPARLMNDQDGACAGVRDTLSFCSYVNMDDASTSFLVNARTLMRCALSSR